MTHEPVGRVSPADEERLRLLAEAVASYLRVAGLPVTLKGNCLGNYEPSVPGAEVFYDPLADHDGVYVSWNVGGDLMAAARSGDRPAIMFGAAALDAMMDALTRVLAGAGWEVDARNVGVHELARKVVPTPSSPSAPARFPE